MYSPSSRKGFLVQRAAWYSVGLLGSRGLPGGRTSAAPFSDEIWAELHSVFQDEVGTYDDWALHRPPDATREGLGLLLIRQGCPVAFVKIRKAENCFKLHREFEALRLVEKARPTSFRFTSPLFEGTISEQRYAGFAPLPVGLHRPPTAPPLDEILQDIVGILSSLQKPPDAPPDSVPMHGDFTPWNLRQLHRDLYLLDWETAGWGPPGADEVMYRSAATTMRLASIDEYRRAAIRYPEAVAFWIKHWHHRIDEYVAAVGATSRHALAIQMLGVLESHD